MLWIARCWRSTAAGPARVGPAPSVVSVLTTALYPYLHDALAPRAPGHGWALLTLVVRNVLLIGWCRGRARWRRRRMTTILSAARGWDQCTCIGWRTPSRCSSASCRSGSPTIAIRRSAAAPLPQSRCFQRLNDPATLYPQFFEARGTLTPYLGYYAAVGALARVVRRWNWRTGSSSAAASSSMPLSMAFPA